MPLSQPSSDSQKKSRHQLHRDLMMTIYQYLFYLGIEAKPDIHSIYESITGIPFIRADNFSRGTIIAVLKNGPHMVETLDPLLDTWSFDRLGLVERAILLVAFAEIKYMGLDKAVAIDVAVKLSQKYADEDAYKLINGVLDRL